MTLSNQDVANLCEITDVVAQYNCFLNRYDKVTVELSQGIIIRVNGCSYTFQYYCSDDALEFAKKVCELAKDRGEQMAKVRNGILNLLIELENEGAINTTEKEQVPLFQALNDKLKLQVPSLKVPEGCYEKDDF